VRTGGSSYPAAHGGLKHATHTVTNNPHARRLAIIVFHAEASRFLPEFTLERATMQGDTLGGISESANFDLSMANGRRLGMSMAGLHPSDQIVDRRCDAWDKLFISPGEINKGSPEGPLSISRAPPICEIAR
jgi:hypothetical protein